MEIKKEKILYVTIFIFFIALALFTGYHHEPWADEAQAWLIARDNNFFDIYFNVLKYEGAPFLWFAILRFVNLLHFPYNLFYLIPIFFSGIGVFLLLFKSKLPPLMKCLIPFSYFICYQYTIVARSYTLIFPIMCLIAINYNNRLKRPFLYSFLLVLLASISAHSFVLSFIFLCLFTFDIINLKLKTNLKNITISLIPAFIVFIYMIFTAILMQKPSDCIFNAQLNLRLGNLCSIFRFTGMLFVLNKVWLFIKFPPLKVELAIFLIVFFYISSVKTFCKNKKQIAFFCILNLGILYFLSIFYAQLWHIGIIFITYVISCWILIEENDLKKIPFKNNFIFYLLFILFFSRQLFFSIKNLYLDIKKPYSASYEVAKFLNKNDLLGKKIIGFGLRNVAVQPYFKKNIYENFKTSYWTWVESLNDERKNYNGCFDILIIDDVEKSVYSKNINNLMKKVNKYHLIHFNGKLYFYGKEKEDTSLTVIINDDYKCSYP